MGFVVVAHAHIQLAREGLLGYVFTAFFGAIFSILPAASWD